METNRDSEIYRAYIEARNNKTNVEEVAKKYGISRQTVYEVIKRVKGGDAKKIITCLSYCRNDCVWEYNFKARFMSLPKNKKKETVKELKEIIMEMYAMNMTEVEIAKRLNLNRSTIRHHIHGKRNKYENGNAE